MAGEPLVCPSGRGGRPARIRLVHEVHLAKRVVLFQRVARAFALSQEPPATYFGAMSRHPGVGSIIINFL